MVNNGSAMHPHGAPGPGEHMRMDKKHTGNEFPGVWVKVESLGPQLQKMTFCSHHSILPENGYCYTFSERLPRHKLESCNKKEKKPVPEKYWDILCFSVSRRKRGAGFQARGPLPKILNQWLTMAVPCIHMEPPGQENTWGWIKSTQEKNLQAFG